MRDPIVAAVMLTCDRPEYARQAVECFRSQTYSGPKSLLVLDTGMSRQDAHQYIGRKGSRTNERLLWNPNAKETIGELRNIAARYAAGSDIICTFDDDDFSHPNRIAEQVALLQASGADAVGYREMLFWWEPIYTERNYRQEVSGKAWLYSNPDPRYILGTSLCYWRKTWERKPFEATSQGEDFRFTAGLNCAALSVFDNHEGTACDPQWPAMIARIHSGNTSNAYTPQNMQRAEWKRVPDWDAYARSVMEPQSLAPSSPAGERGGKA